MRFEIGSMANRHAWLVLLLIGLTAGIFNFFTNLAGILTPIIIGYVLKYTKTYSAGLIYVAAMPLIGVLLYVFVLGDVKRLSID